LGKAGHSFANDNRSAVAAWIGLPISDNQDSEGWGWFWSQTQHFGLFDLMEGVPRTDGLVRLQVRLTFKGWERYEALQRTNVVSRTAFMAMQYGDSTLDNVVSNCFRPAIKRTGFELRLLTDQQPAGLIDNQLRAAILGSRFVISDLTHGNRGAYWEAGFGEGLGLPVIYTCEKEAWVRNKPHFDTNHLLTIIWDIDELKKAEDLLAATIRATFRAEAKQSDDDAEK
jgi:hypothetical protein